MSSIRTSRTRLMTAAATVALAALSLTACNDGTGVHDEGASAGAASSASPTASSRDHARPAPDGAQATGNGSGAKDPKGSGGDASGTDTSEAVTCQGSNTKMVASPLTRPVNHMLLTVTNTGSATCYLYGYPVVRFGAAQSVPPVIDASHPQAVVTLNPGESGYASVNLSAADGSGTNGRTEKSLTVSFQGRTSGEDVPSAGHPALPEKGVHVDDSLEVTYWQQSMDTAVTW